MSSQQRVASGYPPDQRIIQAVRRLLTSRVGTAFTMDQLAAESALSRATLYRQVGSRKKLLEYLAKNEGLDVGPIDRPSIHVRILAATRRAVSAAGSLNITVEQVAEEAGVGVATVYRHFGDKAGLLQAFVEAFTPRQAVRDLLDHPGGSLEADLIQFTTEVLDFLEEHRDLARLLFSTDEQTMQAMTALRASQDRTLTILTRYLEKKIRAGQVVNGPAFDLANALMGMLVGFAYVKPTYQDIKMDEPAVVARFIVRLFLNGALPLERAASA